GVGVLVFLGVGGGASKTPPFIKFGGAPPPPHDPKAFTQGLEIDGEVLYEGTGLSGASSVRASRLAPSPPPNPPPGASNTPAPRRFSSVSALCSWPHPTTGHQLKPTDERS
ncbi:glutaminyl-peptide cyclotransferase, partial [Nocardia abscessus]|uniref:glutaminyl-peptide cyclotransferase n=1 Tax=Nocardia abscessus TaxID=120957 RepID=UPI003CC7EF29